ncbi:APC family permease [Kitasatospora sp. NPDC057015]|uniref:APC family permease n=1 Tax=Kitasatospora sp. NPDC057015 TaxID=3346001 RepID=UPI00362CA586
MSQMCGIGPFVTIPLMVAAFGGPQAVIGWIAGAVLALADGLVWAELGASLPGAGGSYVYLREAFQYRTGRLMPFLFVWTAMLFIPLIMSTGVVGFVQYLGYLWPGMTKGQGDLVGLALCALVVLLLWRRVESIAKLTTVMWGVMITSVAAVILASASGFSPGRAFAWPAHAVELTHGQFWIGFAAGLTIGIYDYLGYNTAAYLGAEVRNPGRVLPRAIILSIIGIMGIYLLLQVGVLGAMDWHLLLDPNSVASRSVASAVLEQAWGRAAADTVTVLILVTAFASVLTGLLGGSRVPFDAARDGTFFRAFGRLHPRHGFPVLALVTMVLVTAAGFYLSRHVGDTVAHPPLTVLITMLTTVMVLVQALAQIAAVTVLRRRQPGLARPYRMWLYPLPGVVAAIGWLVIYGYADRNSPGYHPVEWSLAWVAAGAGAFLLWARAERTWPFGPKGIREEFLHPVAPAERTEPAAPAGAAATGSAGSAGPAAAAGPEPSAGATERDHA